MGDEKLEYVEDDDLRNLGVLKKMLFSRAVKPEIADRSEAASAFADVIRAEVALLSLLNAPKP